MTVWSEELQDSDGWDAWYNPELAAQELSVAVEELASLGYEVTEDNPIIIDFPCLTINEVSQNQGYVLKTCIEEALGGLVRLDLPELNSATEQANVWNNANNGAEFNYDIGGLGTVGSDHGDPQCYTEGLLPYGDGHMTQRMGMW